MKFNEWHKKEHFKSLPTLYFAPGELNEDLGEFPFIVKFIDEDIKTKKKTRKVLKPDKVDEANPVAKKPKRKTKKLWTMVVEVIADKRKDTRTTPISPDRYLWDLSFENMGKLSQLQERVDIFAVPLLFIHRRRYKGKHPFSFYEFCEIEEENTKPIPEPSTFLVAASTKPEPAPPIVPKTISSAVPSPQAGQAAASITKPVSSAALPTAATRSPVAQPSAPLTSSDEPRRSSGILYDEYGEIPDGHGDGWWWELEKDDMKALGEWERAEKAKATTREQQMALEATAQTIKATWKATGILQLPGVEVKELAAK